MLFNSPEFVFLFLPAVIVAYWAAHLRFGPAGSTVLLAIASYLFYLRNEPNYPFLLAGSILMNFAFGLVIMASLGRRRTLLTAVGIGADLAILGWFKYAGLIAESLAAAGLWSGPIPVHPLPAGISFYTFTQIAFLADARLGLVARCRPTSYALFVTLFPHLIAGPILHHKEMVAQFEAKKRPSTALHLLPGLAIFAIGLAKKTILADSVAPLATGIFTAAEAGHAPGLVEAWIGALAYTMQIYFDFSGYSDMAIGIALTMGIRLPINFASPYKAAGPIEFWRRWHITLSRFLRDYLYIGLGGNRLGPVRRHLNLMVTMTLGGLWHGASWTFVVWGAAHGAGLVVAHGWQALRRRAGVPAMPRPLAVLLTFGFVTLLWVPFRADGFATVMRMWTGMIGHAGLGLPQFGSFAALARRFGLDTVAVPFGGWDLAIVGLALAVAWGMPNTQQLMARYRPGLPSRGYGDMPLPGRFSLRLRPLTVIGLALLFGLAVSMIAPDSEFIYFRF